MVLSARADNPSEGEVVARDVQVVYQGGEIVTGVDLEFKALREEGSEYECEDGSVVRIRTVVSKIVRLKDKKNEAGEPVFVVTATTTVASAAS